MKKSYMDTQFDRRILVLNKIIIAFIVLITLVPMIYIIVASFMDPKVLATRGISFNPEDWTVEGYKRVFSDQSILRGFLNSLLYSFGFATLTVLLSVFTAYPLSKRNLVGRKWINYFLIVTMFFGGGLVPTYLLVKDLGMLNTPWAIIVPGAVNVWNIILARAYFQGLPEELEEAAVIDGANDIKIFFKITLPYMLFVTTPYLITSFVGNINNFNVIYLLSGGGPTYVGDTAGQTDLLVTWLYKLTIDQQYYNLGAVIGILTFIILTTVTLITYRRSKSYQNEEAFM